MAGKWRYLKCLGGEQVKVDSEDYEELSQSTWRVTKTLAGRKRVVTSRQTPQGPRSYTLGKVLMNPPAGKQVAIAFNKASKKYFGDNGYQNNLGRKKVARD